MSRSPALAVYLAVSAVMGPLVGRLLARRATRGKEDRARLSERFGRTRMARPPGRLVWLHAASIGEAASARPLIEALGQAQPDLSVLLTTGTRTAAEQIGPGLPPFARHQYVPVDTRAAVRRFLGHWRPDVAVWIESELWPRLVWETARAGVPMALVNARLSERSAARWARAPGMARALVGAFRLVVAQDAETVCRLRALGAGGEIRAGGNLKSAVLPPEPSASSLAEARACLGTRAVWLAASTHPGEEEIVAAAQAQMPRETLLVLAPRHPDRGPEVAEILARAGLSTARRSLGQRPSPETRVWLADTLGEMGLWYRLAPVSFIGGSLVAMGGHTPFEPAALGSAIVHGPETANFAPAYRALAEAGGARLIGGADDLAAAVSGLLGDPAARTRMTEAARTVRTAMTPDVAALAADLLALGPGER